MSIDETIEELGHGHGRSLSFAENGHGHGRSLSFTENGHGYGRSLSFAENLRRKSSVIVMGIQYFENREAKFERERPRTARFMIPHECTFKMIWDISVAFNLIYVSISLPFVLAFVPHHPASIKAVDNVVDIFFLMDMVFNFFTTYETSEGELVESWGPIICHYLKGWFFIDFTSTVPIEWFIKGNITRMNKLAKVMRAFKFLKMLRISKMGRLVPKIQSEFNIKNATLSISKFVFVIMMTAHWCGCLFFILARSEGFAEKSFPMVYLLEAPDGLGPLRYRSVGSQYLASMYWSITIMSTIGFGDICPGTDKERLFVTLVMLIGASIFAYGVTNMCNLVANLDQDAAHFSVLQDRMKNFVEKRKINEKLRNRVRLYLLHKKFHSSVEMFGALKLFDQTSGVIKTSAVRDHAQSLFWHTKTLQRYGDQFIQRIACHFKGYCYAPDEPILAPDTFNKDIFLVSRGRVEVVLDPKEPEIDLPIVSLPRKRRPSIQLPRRNTQVHPSSEYDASITSTSKPSATHLGKVNLSSNEAKTLRKVSGLRRKKGIRAIQAIQVILPSGCSFNEAAALLGRKSSMSAFSMSYTDIYTIPSDQYRSVLERNYPGKFEDLMNELQLKFEQDVIRDFYEQLPPGHEICGEMDESCHTEELVKKGIEEVKEDKEKVYHSTNPSRLFTHLRTLVKNKSQNIDRRARRETYEASDAEPKLVKIPYSDIDQVDADMQHVNQKMDLLDISFDKHNQLLRTLCDRLNLPLTPTLELSFPPR